MFFLHNYRRVVANIREIIYRRIAERRNQLGITVAELSRRSGVSKRTIHRLEEELEVNITINSIEKIWSALGLSLSDFFQAAAISRSELNSIIDELQKLAKRIPSKKNY